MIIPSLKVKANQKKIHLRKHTALAGWQAEVAVGLPLWFPKMNESIDSESQGFKIISLGLLFVRDISATYKSTVHFTL